MSPSHRQRAFTLLELLVATTITALIVVLFGSIFTALSRTAARANQRVDAFREARAALHLMERDFSNVITARDLTNSGSTGITPYFVIDTDAAGNNGAAIRQIEALVGVKNQPSAASGSTTPAPGDVCAVRYYALWDATKRVYNLNRFFRESASTLSVISTLVKSSGYADIASLYQTAGTGSQTVDETLAASAWALRVTAYDGSGNIMNLVKDTSGTQTSGAPYTCDLKGAIPAPRPAAIEISFKAISASAARTVVAATAGMSNGYDVWMAGDNPSAGATEKQLYQTLIAPNVYVFRSRINLQ